MLHTTLTELIDDLFESDEVKAAAVSHIMAAKGMDEPGLLFGSAATNWTALTNPDNQGIAVGGMGGLSSAIARSAQAAGAKIRCGAEVKRVLLKRPGRGCGIYDEPESPVAASSSPTPTPNARFCIWWGRSILPPGVADSIRGLETACATLKFHAIVNELPDSAAIWARTPTPS